MWRASILLAGTVWHRLIGRQSSHFTLYLLPIALLIGGCSQTAEPTPPPPAVDNVAGTPEESVSTALPTATAAPRLPRFEPTECRFRQPAWPDIQCGDLLVPENRNVENSTVNRLHVAVLRSKAEQPEPDPLIYLSG